MDALERWRWRCEHARCGSEIGPRERVAEIARIHQMVTGHSVFLEMYRLPSLPSLS